jgi:AcrR family transcriptional regulator
LATAVSSDAAPKEESLRLYVAAARRCFWRDGVSETRMEDIAQEAGLSRQYLYRLVSGREELIEMAMIDRAREFTDDLAARAERLGSDGDLEESFIDQIVFAVSLGRDDPEFVRLAGALPRDRTNHALTSSDSPFHGYTARAFEPLFARALSEGRLRTDVSVDATVDWLQGVLALLAGRDDLDDAAERRLIREFILPGLLKT